MVHKSYTCCRQEEINNNNVVVLIRLVRQDIIIFNLSSRKIIENFYHFSSYKIIYNTHVWVSFI